MTEPLVREMDMKSLKTLLSRLEMRRLEDKEKIRALGISMKKTKEALKKSPQNRCVSWQQDENRIDQIGAAIKDLRLKLEVQGALLRDLHNENNYDKDDSCKLIDTLERGIRQGRKHLDNLEDLYEPLSLLIDSDNSLRQAIPGQNVHDTTTSSL
ncbi:hypothetical protein QZH41_010735 [Actinostola sp. cb2023]|nr:hypothetical protein QZH41_010735 [Actinostola sp. cb2023]